MNRCRKITKKELGSDAPMRRKIWILLLILFLLTISSVGVYVFYMKKEDPTPIKGTFVRSDEPWEIYMSKQLKK